MQFSIAPGVVSLLSSAVSNERAPSEFKFYLSGDLSQMGIQDCFLRNAGFEVARSNVYPVLKEADVPKALQMIWEYKVEGWWHYKEKYVALQICTGEQFDVALTAQVERNKQEWENERNSHC
ncbi:MAG: hypothetical protein PHF86_12580 [Candidatus Nanoarchaeia archaeon]|jgi:hypothetical protein|nr:hypothetical protein [Candidatus Nanoarchaeia archaeon]